MSLEKEKLTTILAWLNKNMRCGKYGRYKDEK